MYIIAADVANPEVDIAPITVTTTGVGFGIRINLEVRSNSDSEYNSANRAPRTILLLMKPQLTV